MNLLHRHFDRLVVAIFAAGFGLFVASAFTGAGADLIVGDAVEYFEYARSVAVEGRLPSTHIKYPAGVALIGSLVYMPAVVLGKALVAGGLMADSRLWRTGWALPQQIAFCLPFFVLAWLACHANVRMMVRLGYSATIVRPLILFWILTTNIGFFMLKEPAMSESATYSLLSLFYAALVTWFYVPPDAEPVYATAGESLRRAAILGLLLGLAGTVRQQNILHCVALPLLLAAQSRHRLLVGPRSLLVAAAAITSAVLFVIPWIIWYWTDGMLRFFSYGEEHFNFLSPRPLDALFHPGYHGLFVWHPAFALAAAGLFLFLRRHRALAVAWLTPMAIQFYLVVSWYWLSFGASVGHRGFFPLFPLLVAGWVAAGEYAVQRGWQRATLVSLVVLACANAVITVLLLTRRLDPLGLPPDLR